MRQARKDWREHHRVKAITGFVRREWPVLAWLISFVALAWVILQVSTFSGDLRDGLVASCQKNGNPLRQVVRDILQTDIEQSKSLDYEQFFPNIPPAQLHALIHQENKESKRQLKTIEPLDCAALYPK